MSMEHLKKIREYEEQADKIKRDSLSESKRIASEAADKAAALINSARSEADALYRKTLAVANKEAMDDYDKIIAQAHWESDMLLTLAEKNLDKAISVIVGKVVD